MEIISAASETVRSILKNLKKADAPYRLMHFCVEHPTEDGVLIFNLLTRELVLLNEDECSHLTELDDLKRRWFLVPEGTNEKEYADLVKWVLTTRQKNTNNITGYTIFTTTDCNARCFYCFEAGRSRIPMNEATASKTVQYIKDHCGGDPIRISWFGGEPLFNQDAIDTICEGLRQENITFVSTMVSNGYLFDDETIQKAIREWNLKRVQITLDGTEEVYNKAKAFIYREGSAYQKVLGNMEHLLDAGVSIQVRLNMDLYNAENLLELVDELAKRFAGRKGLFVYAHHLFDVDKSMAETHTEEEWDKRDEAMCRLNEKLKEYGLSSKRGISKHIKLNHCMADSGKSVTILPDGNIGLCEHFSEDEFIGHLDKEGFDPEMVKSWKETVPEIPECAECFYYPECIKLKKCANDNICFRQDRNDLLRKTKQQMLNEYENWKSKAEVEDSEETDEC